MKVTLFFLVITSIGLRVVGMEGQGADRGWYRNAINIAIVNHSEYDLVIYPKDCNQNRINLSNGSVAHMVFKMIKSTVPMEPVVIDKNSSFEIKAASSNFLLRNEALGVHSLLEPQSLTINSERITFILNLFTVYANGATTGPQTVSFEGKLVQSQPKENYFLVLTLRKLKYMMENDRSNVDFILFDPEEISMTFNRTKLTKDY